MPPPAYLIDFENLQIGDPNPLLCAKVLKIVFEKCNNDTIAEGVCKSDQEIKEFLRRKFIMTLNNQIRFNTMEYDEDRIVKESILSWYPIHS